MEGAPEKLTRNIRHVDNMPDQTQIFVKAMIGLFDYDPEDLTRNEQRAEYAFQEFEKLLRKHGIRLTGFLKTKDVKVLEVGSGNAFFLNAAKKKGVNIVGVDARPRGETNDSQVLARVEQLPFKDNEFNVVFSHGIFDKNIYEQDWDLMGQEISRVLKQGGVYIGLEGENHPSFPGLKLVPGNPYEYVYKKINA